MEDPTLGTAVPNRPADLADSQQQDPGRASQKDLDMRHSDSVHLSQRNPADSRQACLVSIRHREQERLLASLIPGHIIQVSGPPLSGKSTLVQRAVDGITEESNFLRHDFMCDMASSLPDVLRLIAESLNAQPTASSTIDEEQILSVLTSTLAHFPSAHHVLVFHKCHNLWHKAHKTDSPETTFLGCLRRMTDRLSKNFEVSIVLTSCKKFSMKGHKISTIEIGMLNGRDITRILQKYSPNINVLPYANICLNMLPLPGAVRLFGAKYLANETHLLPPGLLEVQIVKDESFWSQVFEGHVDSVEKWIPRNVLASMVHFSQFFGNSFYEAHLECTVAGSNKQMWQKFIDYLRRAYIVWPLPGTNRLVVHPLVVYYLNKSRCQNNLVLRGRCYDHSCNRYTDFLCRMLRCTEMNMEKLGNTGIVYGCLAAEWPNIRHLIEMAINCNENTYKLFLKAAVSGRSIMHRCFSEEAHDMYSALFECAKKYGTLSEQGMVQALLGHSKACSAILSKGGTWQQAEDCLDSAIEKLRKTGPSFGLMWAICRKAIILSRQGKYKEAQMCFKAARRVIIVEADDRELKETFGVSKLQIKEEKITRDIYTTNVLIFIGENDLAQEILLGCYQDMQNEFLDHPEMATAVNSLGLIEERGHQDKKKALQWYQESYRIRQKVAKFNKEILVAPLNNIGMLHLRLGNPAECKKCLSEALNIMRELGWRQANTSLTLTHMGVVNFRSGDFAAAYKNTLDAEKILEKNVSKHDTRLRINNTLGHLSQLLEIERQLGQNNAQIQSERSAKEYFAQSLDIACRITGNLSDDGYHHLLLAHEHAMMLALGHSEEDYNMHKENIVPYLGRHETVGKKVFIANEKIPNHKDLFDYFSTRDYESIDKRIFISHLAKACEFCQVAVPFYSPEEMWCEDKLSETHCEENRDLTQSILPAHENDNPNNFDVKTNDSDVSDSACLHQDKRTPPSSTDFCVTFPMPKSQEDLEEYKSLYLSTVTDTDTQKSLLSSSGGDLDLQHNDNITPCEKFTNNNDFPGEQELIPVDLQFTTPDSTQFNKGNNTEYTPSVNENMLKDYTNSNYPSALVEYTPSDNSHDNVKHPVMSSTSDYSDANMPMFDQKYQYPDENKLIQDILHDNSSISDNLENNGIIEYDNNDDYDYTDDDDYDDDIVSETDCNLNESHQYEYPLSSRDGVGLDNRQIHAFPLKTDQIKDVQSWNLSELQSPEMSHDMKDALNQNSEPGMSGIDNKQYQVSSK